MFDVSRLSPEAYDQLIYIAGQDGNEGDLSAVDLTTVPAEELTRLADLLKRDGFDLNEQQLTEVIRSLTADKTAFKGGQYKSFDFQTGQLAFGNLADVLGTSEVSSGDAAAATLGGSAAYKPAKASATTTYDPAYGFSESRIKARDEARVAMAKYGITPENAYSPTTKLPSGDVVPACIAEKAGKIPAKDLPRFIEQYMTAFYEHPGKDVAWAGDIDDRARASKLLFGADPKIEQLPDGRRVIDCTGFAQLGEILFDTLLSDEQRKGAIYLPIEYQGTTADKGQKFGHELALMVIDGKAYVVDNNKVRPIDMNAMELDFLRSSMDGYTPIDKPGLTDKTFGRIGIAKEDFPSVFAYIGKYHQNHQVGTIIWDQGNALDGDKVP